MASFVYIRTHVWWICSAYYILQACLDESCSYIEEMKSSVVTVLAILLLVLIKESVQQFDG